MGADCGVWIAKYVLCIFNFLFFVLATIVLGTGIWLAIDKASLIALTKMVENDQVNQFTQPQVIEQFAYCLIAIGAIMFVMSFMGYCGAIRESRCLLSTYGIFMCILLVVEIVACGLAVFYKEKARDETKLFLQDTIQRYYSTAAHTDAVTLMWNELMASFGCCGVNNYRDFERTDWYANRGNRTMPEACCILKDLKEYTPRDEDCTINPNDYNSYYTKGCFDEFSGWIIMNREIIIAVLASIGIVHLIAIVLSFALCHAYGKYQGMRL